MSYQQDETRYVQFKSSLFVTWILTLLLEGFFPFTFLVSERRRRRVGY